MFLHLLTYHQTSPSFLDFVFPFGDQEYPLDSGFGGFRSQTFVDPLDRGLQLPQLDRSGLGFQQCYSLKSVEPSRGTRSWPWSIRQSSVCHSFDLESGHSLWIIVKGSTLIRDRVSAHFETISFRSLDAVSNAFLTSLEPHLILCDWVDEHWRWYINYMDEQLHSTSRPLLTISIDPTSNPPLKKKLTKAATWSTEKDDAFSKMTLVESIVKRLKATKNGHLQIGNGRCSSSDLDRPDASEGNFPFSFEDIQRMQYIKENANEARLVLSSDIDVLKSLGSHYRNLWDGEDFSLHVKSNCKAGFKKFQAHVDATIESLRMSLSRTENLLQLLDERKTLVNLPQTLEKARWAN